MGLSRARRDDNRHSRASQEPRKRDTVNNSAIDAPMGRADRGRDTRLPPVVVGGLAESKVRRVTAFIENNLHRELRLEELAVVTHMSPYHFARLQAGHVDIAASLRGAPPDRRRDRSVDRVHLFHQLDRPRGGVRDRESFRDDGSAHHGHDPQRVSSAQSRRRGTSRDAAGRRRGRRREDSDATKVG